VLLDPADAVLLVRYEDSRPGRPPSFWAAPGGALEAGETHLAAATRELQEETGLEGRVERELWKRSFDIDYGFGPVHQVEQYFLGRVDTVRPEVINSSPEAIREHRWWTVGELQTTQEVVFPDGLAEALATIIAAGDAA
jgi:8-oxo-dGTP pyrophosphatase MutT (NUDIX family)